MGTDSELSRRAVLAATATGLGGLAGCADRSSGDPSTRTESATPADGATPPLASGCLDASALAALEPEPPYADPATVRDAPGDCPEVESPQFWRLCEAGYLDRVCEDRTRPDHRIVCGSAAEDPPLRMVAERDHLDLPGRLGFTVVNGTDRPFSTNFYAWVLWKRVDGRWYHVAPASHLSPSHGVDSGSIHHYCVEMGNDSVAGRRLPFDHEPTKDPGDRRWGLTVPALGGGEYAFGLFGQAGPETDRHHKIGLVARISLDGDPVEVTRTGLVENVTQDGETVTGEWAYERDAEGGEPHDFELRRIDDGRETIRVLPEELLRKHSRTPLRDMVALSREFDADVVRIRTWNFAAISRAPPHAPFEYDGQAYEASVQAV